MRTYICYYYSNMILIMGVLLESNKIRQLLYVINAQRIQSTREPDLFFLDDTMCVILINMTWVT